jgi:hypothetical protein
VTDLSVVWPVRVVGTNVVHLAQYEEPDYADPSDVARLVAVCPTLERIGALELLPVPSPAFVVCPDCRSWLAEANPVGLATLMRGAKT